MRNLSKVITQMLAYIPDEASELREGLKSVRSSASFAAPEMQGQFWYRGAECLSSAIPPNEADLNEWQRKVVDIWTDKKEHSR